MRRRELLAAAAAVFPSHAATPAFYARLAEFDRVYLKFLRTLAGCPEKGDEALCRPGQGYFDARAFRLAGRLAKELFT